MSKELDSEVLLYKSCRYDKILTFIILNDNH